MCLKSKPNKFALSNFNKDEAAKSKKNISMEEAKELAVPIIKEMEVKQCNTYITSHHLTLLII